MRQGNREADELANFLAQSGMFDNTFCSVKWMIFLSQIKTSA